MEDEGECEYPAHILQKGQWKPADELVKMDILPTLYRVPSKEVEGQSRRRKHRRVQVEREFD